MDVSPAAAISVRIRTTCESSVARNAGARCETSIRPGAEPERQRTSTLAPGGRSARGSRGGFPAARASRTEPGARARPRSRDSGVPALELGCTRADALPSSRSGSERLLSISRSRARFHRIGTVRTSKPPGRRTRAISVSTARSSGTCSTVSEQITTSNSPDRKGSAVASAQRSSILGCRGASSRNVVEKSTATTSTPRSASTRSYSRFEPQPTSRTLSMVEVYGRMSSVTAWVTVASEQRIVDPAWIASRPCAS